MSQIEVFAYLVLPTVVVVLGLAAAYLHGRSMPKATVSGGASVSGPTPGDEEIMAALRASIQQLAQQTISDSRSGPVSSPASQDRLKSRVPQS